MKMLEAEMKKKFLCGIVLYDGNEIIPFEKNLYAVPIQTLRAIPIFYTGETSSSKLSPVVEASFSGFL